MPPPAQHVQETWSAAEFYGNKVLMEWRAKDPNHVTWVGAVKAAMLALRVGVRVERVCVCVSVGGWSVCVAVCVWMGGARVLQCGSIGGWNVWVGA